jgi:opacity protein-like surface antigen
MKKKLLSLLCTPFCAFALEDPYVLVAAGFTYVPSNINITTMGYTRNDVAFNAGFNVNTALGVRNSTWRYEGEITYLQASTDSFKINSVNQTGVGGFNNGIFAMSNVYYDFSNVIPEARPFIGGGIGYAFVQAKLSSSGPNEGITNFTATNSALAYQVTFGITYNFTENYAINCGYRYLGTTDLPELGESFGAHMANFGLKYRF